MKPTAESLYDVCGRCHHARFWHTHTGAGWRWCFPPIPCLCKKFIKEKPDSMWPTVHRFFDRRLR